MPHLSSFVDQYLQLLGPLGICKPNVRFQIPETETERQAATRLLRQAGFQEGSYAAINAGAGWPSKQASRS